MCCESWSALCRCCAACWKTAPSLLQLRWYCLLRLLRFCCWCPSACVNCCPLRGRRCRCGCLVVQNLLHDPQHLCRCHGVVRLPEQRAQLPCGTLVIYSHLRQVASKTKSRSVACAHIVMWTTSECGAVFGALCHQTPLHARKSHSASVCITANAANRPPSCSCICS